MTEPFKILVCIIAVMVTIADSGLINPSWQYNFLPSWMYGIILFYVGIVVIVERFVPLFKELYDLLKKLNDP